MGLREDPGEGDVMGYAIGIGLVLLVVWVGARRRRQARQRRVSTDALVDALDLAIYRGRRWRPRVRKGRWWL